MFRVDDIQIHDLDSSSLNRSLAPGTMTRESDSSPTEMNSMSNPVPLTMHEVADAVAYVNHLDFNERIELCEKIGKLQPATMGAVVQLTSLGVDYATQEHALYVLMVLYRCFTRNRPSFPRITQQVVQKALDDNAAMLALFGKESPAEASRLMHLGVENYPERDVLVFVTGYLNDQGLTEFSRERELVLRVCIIITNAFVVTRGSIEKGAD